MSRDVYAGDIAPNLQVEQKPTRSRLTIRADADPDVLLRIAVALSCINDAPRELHLQSESEGMVRVEVLIDTATAQSAENVRRKLLQLSCTLDVDLSTVS